MAGLLGQVFSAGNVARRKLTDLLGNPVLSAQQIVGNLNDRARVLNEMTAAAAKEGVDYGPASRQLAGLLAEAYNPIGMMVYHGSPAKFSRFDPTKIGSGEGAQAYGYGHYVAQNPAVAKEYRTALSEPELFVKGRQIKTAAGSNMDTAKAWLQDSFEMGAKNPYADAIEKVSNAPLKDKQGVIDALRKLENRGVQMQKGGFEYEIDLPDEQIARMLDWDKPLIEQPNVLKALETHPIMGKESLGWKGAPEGLWEKAMSLPSKTGEWLYREMQGNNPIETSEALRQAGIPGIRYLDQASRGTGEGTSNFVVFPGGEDLLTILKRNGGLLGPYPQEQALRLAQKNAAKPISEGGLGLPPDNTAMDRAKAMGFDTPIYHATSADFGEFVPSSLRGASYFASSPERAMRGAKAGAADRLGAGQPDRVMPLLARSQEVEGLTISKPQREWFNSLPQEATESQVESLMNKAPKDGYWFMWYDEIQLPSGEFKYIKKQEPFVSYEQAVKTNKDIYGRGFSDYSDASSERFASEMAKNQGRGAYLQNDESGLAMAVVDPSIVRSRFAAFDPARRNEADILAGVLPLSLLADEEQRKKADAYFRSLLGQ